MNAVILAQLPASLSQEKQKFRWVEPEESR